MLQEKLVELMSQPNALDYSLKELKAQHDYESILYSDKIKGSQEGAERMMLAISLCGIGNCGVAMDFMSGKDCSQEFFGGIYFDSIENTPLIVRAINIRLSTNNIVDKNKDWNIIEDIRQEENHRLQICMNRMRRLSIDCSDNFTHHITTCIQSLCEKELNARGIEPDYY